MGGGDKTKHAPPFILDTSVVKQPQITALRGRPQRPTPALLLAAYLGFPCRDFPSPVGKEGRRPAEMGLCTPMFVHRHWGWFGSDPIGNGFGRSRWNGFGSDPIGDWFGEIPLGIGLGYPIRNKFERSINIQNTLLIKLSSTPLQKQNTRPRA